MAKQEECSKCTRAKQGGYGEIKCSFYGRKPQFDDTACSNFVDAGEVKSNLDKQKPISAASSKTAADIINEHKQKEDNLRETIRKKYNIEGDISEEEYNQLLAIYKEEERNSTPSYQPPKTPNEEKKISKETVVILLIVIILGALVAGYFIRNNYVERKAEEARIERIEQERIEQERRAEQERRDMERRAELERQERIKKERQEQEFITQKYSWMNGRWYISSYIDDSWLGRRYYFTETMTIDVANRTIKVKNSMDELNYNGTFSIDEDRNCISWSNGDGTGTMVSFDPYKQLFYENYGRGKEFFHKR